MKASAGVVEALADVGRVEDGPTIRRIGSEMLLALARKEIPSADVEAGAKMVAAIGLHWSAQLRMEAQADQMRDKLAALGRRRPEDIGDD